MTYTRADFERRLERGNQTEAFLAEKLHTAGIVVVKPEYPEGMPTSYYTKNQVDLLANDHVLEVKGRDVNYKDVGSYPYPTVFVESVSGFDAKVHTPAFYVNVSNKTGAVIALDVAETKDRWIEEKITDRRRGYSYQMYVAEIGLWIDWEDFLGRLK